jgi:hypothetical protein
MKLKLWHLVPDPYICIKSEKMITADQIKDLNTRLESLRHYL